MAFWQELGGKLVNLDLIVEIAPYTSWPEYSVITYASGFTSSVRVSYDDMLKIIKSRMWLGAK
jgi:hypothetical protein